MEQAGNKQAASEFVLSYRYPNWIVFCSRLGLWSISRFIFGPMWFRGCCWTERLRCIVCLNILHGLGLFYRNADQIGSVSRRRETRISATYSAHRVLVFAIWRCCHLRLAYHFPPKCVATLHWGSDRMESVQFITRGFYGRSHDGVYPLYVNSRQCLSGTKGSKD